jgi:exodeoxyribonuclease VII large subunit
MTATRVPLTVSQLTGVVRGALAAAPELEDVLVEGELSNLRNPGSGHLYFTLKDATAQLRCVCFRSNAVRIPFHPEGGMTVIARGHVEVYDAEGSYQLYVDTLEPAGIGAIALAVEQRKRRLAAEGVFAAAAKRALPLLPRRIAVVTSSTGAAVRDVVTVARRRARVVGVVVVPTPVQGDGAEASIVRALREAEGLAGVDVILLVRGGGSFEDLVAFQSEEVARAIRRSRRPVVTGIGHETDTTIADLAADRRGATPSNAAEIAVPDLAALREDLLGTHQRLRTGLLAELAAKRRLLAGLDERLAAVSPSRRLPALRQQLDGRVVALRTAVLAEVGQKRRRLDGAAAALRLASPQRRLPQEREALRRRRGALAAATSRVLALRRSRLETAAARLEALSPQRVLERGFSITMGATGGVLRRAVDTGEGELLTTRLAEGELRSRVVQS